MYNCTYTVINKKRFLLTSQKRLYVIIKIPTNLSSAAVRGEVKNNPDSLNISTNISNRRCIIKIN